MTVDPVCGMAVRPTPRMPISEHAGVVYAFCTAVCQARFDRQPARFARPGLASRAAVTASAARARSLGSLLRRLARHLADPVTASDRPAAPLAAAERRTLVEIGERGRVRMSELASLCGHPLSTTTGLVDRLEQKGQVRRVRDRTDRRVVLVELTRAGARAHAARLRDDMRLVITLLDALSAAEQLAVIRALTQVASVFEAIPASAPRARVAGLGSRVGRGAARRGRPGGRPSAMGLRGVGGRTGVPALAVAGPGAATRREA